MQKSNISIPKNLAFFFYKNKSMCQGLEKSLSISRRILEVKAQLLSLLTEVIQYILGMLIEEEVSYEISKVTNKTWKLFFMFVGQIM